MRPRARGTDVEMQLRALEIDRTRVAEDGGLAVVLSAGQARVGDYAKLCWGRYKRRPYSGAIDTISQQS